MQVSMGPFSCEIFTKNSPFVVEVEMTERESLRNEIDKISVSTKMSDENFMIHVFNNLTEDYGVVLGGMESRLMIGAKRERFKEIDN